MLSRCFIYFSLAYMSLAYLPLACVTCLPFAAYGEGTETLGDPEITISPGSSLLVAGTGMNSQPGTIAFTLPAGAIIKQVLLYWQEWFGICEGCPGAGDSTIVLTPHGSEISGVLIGGGNNVGYTAFHPVTYRADITAYGVVVPGANSFAVSGLSMLGIRPDGAGMVVIFDTPGSNPATLKVRDGSDTALLGLAGDLAVTVPQTFTYTPAPVARSAEISLFVSSIDGGAGNSVRITFSDGTVALYNTAFANNDGLRWDSVVLPVSVPAGTTSVTVEVISGGVTGDCIELGRPPLPDEVVCPGVPSSLVWLFVGVRIPDAPPVCRIGGPYELQCGGITTRVTVDGQGAYDPEGGPLTYAWSTDCVGGSLSSVSGTQTTILSLTQPGRGLAQSCAVMLKVSDGAGEAACSTNVSAGACILDCLGIPNGTAKYDLCGECNGANRCFDCLGVPNGSAKFDECGVCEGDNSSCADCSGVPHGTAVKDACGVCNGDNSKCRDCLGVPNGAAVLDSCGVCNGKNECAPDPCEKDVVVTEVNTVEQNLMIQRDLERKFLRALSDHCGFLPGYRRLIKQYDRALRSLWRACTAAIDQIATVRSACSELCTKSDNGVEIKNLQTQSSRILTQSLDILRMRYTCAEDTGKCSGDPNECRKRLLARQRGKARARYEANLFYRRAIESLKIVPKVTYRCSVQEGS